MRRIQLLFRPKNHLRAAFFCLLGAFFVGVFGTFCLAADERSDAESAGLGPCDLLIDDAGTTLYTLEEEARLLRASRIDRSEAPQTVALPMRPTRMTFLPDKHVVAVVGGDEQGRLLLVRVADDSGQPIPPTLERQFNIDPTPSDVAAVERGGGVELCVAHRFEGTVVCRDALTGKERIRYEAGREPFALEAAPDGSRLVVANLTAEGRADIAYTMACVRIVDLKTDEVHKIELLNGVSNLKDIAVSPDGTYAFVTGTIGNYQTVTSQVVGGWIVENIFSVVDVPNHQLVDTFYLDDSLRGAPNPWGITLAADGDFLAIALSGSNEIVLMSYERVLEILRSRPVWNRPGYGSYTLNTKADGPVRLPLRIRVTLGQAGLRRVAMRGNTVYVPSFFEDSVGRLDVELSPPYEHYKLNDYKIPTAPKPLRPEEDAAETPENAPLRFVELEPYSPLSGVEIRRSFARLGPKPVLSQARRGDMLFHSALYCMEHWQSCATCHPDGRVDGLNWDLMNDGVGNPKNTKSLLLSHETPPAMITGVRADAETAVRAGVTHILFGKLSEADCEAMDEYLKNLRPAESPHKVGGQLSESAQRGRFLFESPRTGCSDCHPEPYFTDLRLHATGSQDYNESRTRFDTPTLIEVWRTAPYMNNGHYLTVRELLVEGQHGNRDERLGLLTEQELDDLIEYVLSL